MKTKVLVISDDPNTHSGFGTVVNRLFSSIIDQYEDKIEVKGVAIHPENNKDLRPYTITATIANNPMDKYGAITTNQIYQAWKPDIIFLLGDPWYWNKDLLNPAWRKSVGIESQIWYYVPLDGVVTDEELKEAYKGADQLISMTPFGQQLLLQYTGKSSLYVPHGYDSNHFLPRVRPKKKAGDKYVFGAVSRNTTRKNVWAIVNAFETVKNHPLVKQMNLDLYLKLHVPKDDRIGGNIEYHVNNFASDKVTFTNLVGLNRGKVKGIPADQLQHKVYDEMDCVVSAGREGFGIPYLEARKCGCQLVLPGYSGHASMGYNETVTYPVTQFKPDRGYYCVDMVPNHKDLVEGMVQAIQAATSNEIQPLDDHDELAWENLPAKTLGDAIVNAKQKDKQDPEHIVVYRGIGGLGDVLTLSPALSSLHEVYPRARITLVVDSKYWMAMTLPFIELAEETPLQHDLFFDVGPNNDPCTKFEQDDLRTHGHFVRSRVQAFAYALGVPIYNYSKPIIEFQDQVVEPEGKYIIVQAKAAEDYKSYQSTKDLVSELALHYQCGIYLETDGKFRPSVGGKVLSAEIEPEDSDHYYSIVKHAQFCIGFDSFLLHVCHALEVPFYAIMGPTHPEARITTAPNIKAIHAKLDCIGCGRWAGSKCKVTDSLESACMQEEHLPIDTIIGQINE